MAKVMQIFNDICYWDATKLGTLEEVQNMFSSDTKFVETPDYVFEGWGYLNGEFIKPEPPEGWLYDDKTGTFYPINPNPDEYKKSEVELALEALMDGLV